MVLSWNDSIQNQKEIIMKKLVGISPCKTELIDVEEPQITSGNQVKIKIKYCGVCMSEHYDCSCVVVSEETGSISLAKDGILKRHLSTEMLERMLRSELVPEQKDAGQDWRGKARQLAGKTREKVSGFADSLKKERRD